MVGIRVRARWFVFAAMVLGMVGAPARGAPPVAPSPPSYRVPVLAYRTADSKIGIALAGGTDSFIAPSSVVGSVDSAPAWSPDGTRIAFTSNRPGGVGNADVWVMRADGSNPVRLAGNSAQPDENPAWSPDGTRIAFSSNRLGSNDVLVMAADGSNPVSFAGNDSSAFDGEPAWSPDGTRIAFTSDRAGNFDVWVMGADGLNPVNRTADSGVFDGEPAWSPDGTRIAFTSDRAGNPDVWVMSADGSNPMRLPGNSGVVDSAPAWSPDGTRIAFISDRIGGPLIHDVWIMGADGSNPTLLPFNFPGSETYPAFGLVDPRGSDLALRIDQLPGQVAGAVVGPVNSHTSNAIAVIDQKVSAINSNTKAFCAEGSVREDGHGVLQMYLTLFSKTAQSATINHITNKGTFSRSVDLPAGVRVTTDVNEFLTSPSGPLAGQTDVDTSIEVLAPAPVFLACPVYFNRAIGKAGPVAGGTVQDGSHN